MPWRLARPRGGDGGEGSNAAVAQLFRPGANSIARAVLVAIVAVPIALALVGGLSARSPYVTGEGRFVEQSVPFSHKHHAGDLRIDCRFCHTGVETGPRAVVPTGKVCMTCHSQLWTNAEMLAPVRVAFAAGRPLAWSRVNRVPDYVYFDHHVHVRNGVACASCHGDVRAMPLTRQATPMTMAWCLDCHRDPVRHLIDPAHVLDERPWDGPRAPAAIVARVRRNAPRLTDCSTCHR